FVEDQIASGLFIRLFGRFEAKWHGKQISCLRMRRSGELLAYLVAHHQSPGIQEDFFTATIAKRLCFDVPNDVNCPGTAKALWHLREVFANSGTNILGDRRRRRACMRESIVPRLELEGADVDTVWFEQHVERSDSNSLLRAVALYRGHLLQMES